MLLLSLFVALLALTTSSPIRAEVFVGSNVDSRVIVGLNVNRAGLQQHLPEGWKPVPFPNGPLKGADMIFALIDGVLEMDAGGKPLDPPSRRAVVMVGLGKKENTVRMFVLRILTTVPERNPYGVASAATIKRNLQIVGPADGANTSADTWTINPETGGEITFNLAYTVGKRAWMPAELFPYSAANPEFSRIYRFNQLVDLVISEGLGKPSSGTFKLESDVTEFAPLFDGNEKIVTVIDIPAYVRKVYLP